MEEKYIKFYKTFHKKFKNDENLIHCFELLSDCGVRQAKLPYKPRILQLF